MNIQECNYVSFCVERSIKRVYKSYLRQIDDLYENGVISDEKHDYLRNRVLDIGNEVTREFQESMEKYIQLNGGIQL